MYYIIIGSGCVLLFYFHIDLRESMQNCGMVPGLQKKLYKNVFALREESCELKPDQTVRDMLPK